MFVVFESYYKFGEVNMKIITSESEMEQYCINKLIEYYDDETEVINNTMTIEDYVLSKVDDYSLQDLIELTVLKGNEVVRGQKGWGVRNVVKGERLKEIK